MKVFACRRNEGYSGGLIIVAAESKEDAFLTASRDDKVSYLFDWHDENGWREPDGDINHVTCDTYPFSKWFEVEHLSTDLKTPQVIIEDGYTE